ncbi:enoyl-CoA hydratase/isomerase family protein [Streptomyces sp. 8L]|uniref:enoyl-CoA hydratase/isomerase family protein n=1 Tax=Streptomyces sp. 8L TaxID=2877242 RepID=UPI001CD56161|nr:enoyl-CoA hydratase/isomerase family protein [Streptomyces sp. 8L]MCA1223613.1 enoyl-CoA hydratase/isomerase family protein [Streptomyces sp. 8L]
MSDTVQDFLDGMRSPTVPHVPFDEYADAFKDAFALRRENGICEIRMHSKGGSAVFGKSHHRGWSQILRLVGADPDNELVIITGTGDSFVRPIPDEVVQHAKQAAGRDPAARQLAMHELYLEGTALVKNLIEQINVPTIGAVNGPAGAMSALATLCDITICSDTTTFEEKHLVENLVPADGTWQAYEGLIGIKRASYMAYMHQRIDARTALDWGIVNEVVPHSEINSRAWEIAEVLMRKDAFARRMTHSMFKEYYARFLEGFALQFAMEAWAAALTEANQQAAADR